MANLQKFDERVQKLFERYPGKKQVIARSYVTTVNSTNKAISEAHLSFDFLSDLTGLSVSAISGILSLRFVPRADTFTILFMVVSHLYRQYLQDLASEVELEK